jgi:regulatory protein YycI of two-component signal transduction system YycFG
MEWGRAKIILIISFLVLNVLLAYQLWVSRAEMSGTFLEAAGLSAETERILQEKGIRLKASIPGEKPKLKEIAVVYHRKGGERTKFKSPLESGRLLRNNRLTEAHGGQIANGDSYRLDPFQSENGVYVLNQLYEQLPLFDVNLKLYEQDGKIVAFDQDYAEVIPAADRQEQTVLSAYMAVNYLAENVLESGAVIEDIQLGYHGQLYNSEPQVPWLFPKWRIVLADGDIYYVHAINGAVEKVPTKEQDS